MALGIISEIIKVGQETMFTHLHLVNVLIIQEMERAETATFLGVMVDSILHLLLLNTNIHLRISLELVILRLGSQLLIIWIEEMPEWEIIQKEVVWHKCSRKVHLWHQLNVQGSSKTLLEEV